MCDNPEAAVTCRPLPSSENPVTIGAAKSSSEVGRAECGKKPVAHSGRAGDADGRAPAALLDADRRRERAQREPDQGHAPDGRGPGALQGSARTVRAA